jgi:hypothetical protein
MLMLLRNTMLCFMLHQLVQCNHSTAGKGHWTKHKSGIRSIHRRMLGNISPHRKPNGHISAPTQLPAADNKQPCHCPANGVQDAHVLL